MSDFILNKQKEQSTKVETRMPSVSKAHLALFKFALLILVFAAFITLSILHDKLFLTELVVGATIVALVGFIHMRSQSE